jgi:hypothetical protein
VEYPSTFLGISKSFIYLDWAGEVAEHFKKKQPGNNLAIFYRGWNGNGCRVFQVETKTDTEGERQNLLDELFAVKN